MAVLMAAVPPQERPRERLLARGSDALTERELLALVLRNGAKGTSALDLAAELLAEYGSLGALAAALPEELAMRPGIGPAKAAALVAAFQLARRADGEDELVRLRGPGDVAKVARRELDGARRERLLVLVCDGANRVRRTVIVSEGSVDRSLVPVREILNAEHGVELLGGMAMDVDDLDLRRWHAGEVERVRQSHTVGDVELMGPRRNVELDPFRRAFRPAGLRLLLAR